MDLLMSKLDTIQEKLHQIEQNQRKNEEGLLGAEDIVPKDIGFLREKLDEMERSTMARETSLRSKLEEMAEQFSDKLNCLEKKLQDIERNQSTKEICQPTNLVATESSAKEAEEQGAAQQDTTARDDYLLDEMDQLLQESESKLQAMLDNFASTLNAGNNVSWIMKHDINLINEYLRDKLGGMDRLLEKRESKLQNKLVNIERTLKAMDKTLLEMKQTMKARDDILHNKLLEYGNIMKASKTALKEVEKPIATIPNPVKTPASVNAPYKSCEDIPPWKSGVYKLEIGPNENISVYCEQIYFGGGWIVIQQRFNGEVDFNRSWTAYRDGFGNVSGEFWLGLENIYRLTSSKVYELLIECEDKDEHRSYARFNDFWICSRGEGYALSHDLGLYDRADSEFMPFEELAGSRFNVNYRNARPNGGWWGSPNGITNLNDVYGKQESSAGRKYLLGNFFTCTRMLIRPYDDDDDDDDEDEASSYVENNTWSSSSDD